MLSLLFPSGCWSCEVHLDPHSILCKACRGKLAKIQPPWCSRCGAPIPLAEISGVSCLACYQTPPAWDCLRSVFVYREPLRSLIHRWKFNDQPQISDFLGEAMVDFIHTYLFNRTWDAIVPVPLYPIRERERDYNQAQLLARILSRELKIPLLSCLLHRTRPTKAQSSLARSERDQNLRDAFRANAAADGKRILLVDDLYTTGATLHRCTIVLKNQGAQLIDGLTVARALF